MTPTEALKACLDTLEKIAEAKAPIESSSLMDWRRKVKIMAGKAHAQALLSLKEKARSGPCPGCVPALNPPPAPGESCCVCGYTNHEIPHVTSSAEQIKRRPNPADGAPKPRGYNPVA